MLVDEAGLSRANPAGDRRMHKGRQGADGMGREVADPAQWRRQLPRSQPGNTTERIALLDDQDISCITQQIVMDQNFAAPSVMFCVGAAVQYTSGDDIFQVDRGIAYGRA